MTEVTWHTCETLTTGLLMSDLYQDRLRKNYPLCFSVHCVHRDDGDYRQKKKKAIAKTFTDNALSLSLKL